jgi:hypothetical protein
MNQPLRAVALISLGKEFNALCLTAGFKQQPVSAQESAVPEFFNLIRLACNYNARHHGRRHELLDFINQRQNWGQNGLRRGRGWRCWQAVVRSIPMDGVNAASPPATPWMGEVGKTPGALSRAGAAPPDKSGVQHITGIKPFLTRCIVSAGSC